MSTAQQSHDFSGLFEAEVLVELMLRFWRHPLAEDATYRNWLIEGASEALRESIGGTRLLEGLEPQDVNFVAAVWYVEWCAVEAAPPDELTPQRQEWLQTVRRALPSCFCDPGDLAE